MLLLIDYDNVDLAERRAGLDHVLRERLEDVRVPLENALGIWPARPGEGR